MNCFQYGQRLWHTISMREQKNPSKVTAHLLHQVLKPASVLLFKLKSAIRQDVRQVHRYNAAKMSETFIEIIIRLEKAFSRLNSSSCQTFLICSWIQSLVRFQGLASVQDKKLRFFVCCKNAQAAVIFHILQNGCRPLKEPNNARWTLLPSFSFQSFLID